MLDYSSNIEFAKVLLFRSAGSTLSCISCPGLLNDLYPSGAFPTRTDPMRRADSWCADPWVSLPLLKLIRVEVDAIFASFEQQFKVEPIFE